MVARAWLPELGPRAVPGAGSVALGRRGGQASGGVLVSQPALDIGRPPAVEHSTARGRTGPVVDNRYSVPIAQALRNTGRTGTPQGPHPPPWPPTDSRGPSRRPAVVPGRRRSRERGPGRTERRGSSGPRRGSRECRPWPGASPPSWASGPASAAPTSWRPP